MKNARAVSFEAVHTHTSNFIERKNIYNKAVIKA